LALGPSITVAAYNEVRALQSYRAATTPPSQTVPKFCVPYAKISKPRGAMPAKFVGSFDAVVVWVVVPGVHAPAKLHTQLACPSG
jgi:hypothetical protein